MDWTTGRRDRYEFVEVVNGQEGNLLDGITGGRITENIETALKVSGTLSYAGTDDGWLDRLVRVYLIATDANGDTERVALGTFSTTTPRRKVSAGLSEFSIEMYSRLIALQDDKLEESLGIAAGSNIVNAAAILCQAAGLEVVTTPHTATLATDRFYEAGASALEIVNDLLGMANYWSVGVDAHGRAVLAPYQPPNARAVSWTFRDDEAGIFLPEVDIESDMYDTPNVVVVTVSNDTGTMTATAENSDPRSPFSTVSRGRRIVRRETLQQMPSQAELLAYANRVLADGMMSVESVTLTHSFVPLPLGAVVRFEYVGAGVTRTLAVASKDIDLGNGAMTKTRLRWFS